MSLSTVSGRNGVRGHFSFIVGAPGVVCNVRAGFCKDNNDGLGRATHDCGALT